MTTRFASWGWRGLVLGGAIIGFTAQSASALDYSKHPKDSATVNAILAKGRVSDGDTQDLKRYIAKLPVKADTVIYLDSPGGNVQESLLLGTFFYQSKITTQVDSKKNCTSACAIAFMGGRGLDGKPSRIKMSTGKLGFHSFSREFPDDQRYSSDDMKQVLQRAQTQVGVITDYMRSVEADLDVMRIMLTATHSQMNFVTNDEAIGLGIQVFDEKTNAMIDPAPVLERLAKARAEARIAAATKPVEPAPETPRTQRTPRTPQTTTTTTTTTPGGGGSESPGVTPVVREQPAVREQPTVTPATTIGRRTGSSITESGTR